MAAQNGQEAQVWGQTLTGENKDDTPVLTGTPEKKVCKATFKNGDDVVAEQYGNNGGTVTLWRNAVPKSGYNFAGWNDGGNTYQADAAYIMPAQDVTFTAQWSPILATAPAVGTLGNLSLTYGYTEGSISVTATPAERHTIAGYQWYSNTSASNEGGTLLTGETGSSYTIPTGKTAGTTEYYYCVVTTTRTDNREQASTTSNVATVTVNKAPVSFCVTENTLTYDGNNRGATVTQTEEQTPSIGNAFTVCYKQDGNTVTPKDAGTYEVWVTITNGNFKFDGQTDDLGEMKVGELTIKPRPVTLSGITASNKVYDGTDDATLDYSGVTFTGKMGSDELSVTATGTFDSKDAGSRTVTISNLTLSGEDKGNYVLATEGQQTTATASITAKDITVSITPGGGCFGDITPATAKLNDLVNGENPTVTLTYTGTANDGTDYSSTTVPTEAGNYTVTASISDTNYHLTVTVTEVFVVTKAEQDAPAAPVVKNTTHNSVTLNDIEVSTQSGAEVQYSIDGGETWQDSTEFEDLKASTKYSFVARYAETDNYFASPASEATVVYTRNRPAAAYPPAVTQPEEGGSVTTSPKYPAAGSTVTIRPEPDEGYEVDEVTVTDKDGNPVEVTDNGDGTFSFKQPYGKVTITVTFKEAEVEPETDPVKDCDKDGTCPASKFTDVKMDWTHDGIHYCVENGLMNGTGNDTFNPDGQSARAMLVTVLYRLEGEPEVGENGFNDVPEGEWYTDAVTWAAENKIVEGYDGKFDPTGDITREQFATILYRYAKYKGYNISVGEDTNILSFADAEEISSWAKDAMQWAVGAGLINGKGENNLDPSGKATRAEMAAILYRFCENVAE